MNRNYSVVSGLAALAALASSHLLAQPQQGEAIPVHDLLIFPEHPTVPGTAIIMGRVLQANGKPAVGVQVGAEMELENRFQLLRATKLTGTLKKAQLPYAKKVWGLIRTQAVTDAQGHYRLSGITKAPYNVYIAKPPSGWVAAAAREIQAQPGKIASAPDIRFNRGVLINCQVVDSKTGQPLPGVEVANDGPHRPIATPSILKTTDQAGKITFRVSPGENYIYLHPQYPSTGQLHFEDGTLYQPHGVTQSGHALYASWDRHVLVLDGVSRSNGPKDREIKPFNVKAGQTRNITLRLSQVIETH
jgi:hypothetical protein